MNVEWDLSEICMQKSNDLEAKRKDRLEQHSALDQEILNYRNQIDELKQKIIDAERQKALLDSSDGHLPKDVQ